MISKLRDIFLLASFALFSFSCAEKVEINLDQMELDALAKWMEKNYPDYAKVEEGLYYKIIKGENASGETPDSTKDWVYVTYEGTDLQGNYYANSSKALSKHLGTFVPTTHFVPFISNYVYGGGVLSYGAVRALYDMQVGDSVDIFMSSGWLGSLSASAPYTGFEGNITEVSDQPSRLSMKFHAMTDDPEAKGLKEVEDYAVNVLGLNLSDSIKTGLYYKIIQNTTVTDTVPYDSTINLKYTGKFLDGFVFDTNEENVANDNNLDLETDEGDFAVSPWLPLEYTTNGSEFVEGFTEVTKRMKVGERAIAVFTSSYGYGEEGSTGGATVIQSYDPLVFEIQVLTGEESDSFKY